jgi:hypothetical protein
VFKACQLRLIRASFLVEHALNSNPLESRNKISFNRSFKISSIRTYPKLKNNPFIIPLIGKNTFIFN